MWPIFTITRGRPTRRRSGIRQVMATMYNDTPAGQCGNADCGQMAAWYVFSALGFYPMNPDSGVLPSAARWSARPLFIWTRRNTTGAPLASRRRTTARRTSTSNPPLLTASRLPSLGSPGMTLRRAGPCSWSWGRNPIFNGAPMRPNRPPATMPAGLRYPALPTPASSNETVRLSLPIRVICGSDIPVAGFVPIRIWSVA